MTRLWELTTGMRGRGSRGEEGLGGVSISGEQGVMQATKGRGGGSAEDRSPLTTTPASGGKMAREQPQASCAAAVKGGARGDPGGCGRKTRWKGPTRITWQRRARPGHPGDESGADPVPRPGLST